LSKKGRKNAEKERKRGIVELIEEACVFLFILHDQVILSPPIVMKRMKKLWNGKWLKSDGLYLQNSKRKTLKSSNLAHTNHILVRSLITLKVES